LTKFRSPDPIAASKVITINRLCPVVALPVDFAPDISLCRSRLDKLMDVLYSDFKCFKVNYTLG